MELTLSLEIETRLLGYYPQLNAIKYMQNWRTDWQH